jgi:DNA-binding NarL/FixJ family response regulator
MKTLIAEDSRTVAQPLTALLTGMGAEVVGVAQTEDDALNLVRQHDIHLAIIDLQLAQGTGFGVIRALRNAGGSAAIVVLTNHAVPALKVAAFEAGADYFLDKSRESLTAVHRVVQGLMAKAPAEG